MKRIIILFAVALIALPISAQRRISKRSSGNSRTEAHRQVKRNTNDRHSSSRKVERKGSNERRTYHTGRHKQRNRSAINRSRVQKPAVKNRGNTPRRNISRDFSRNSTSGSKREAVVNSHRKKSSVNRGFARNSFYDRSYNRRSYGKSHGHINHFYRGRKLARNHYYVYNRPHHHVVFRHSWFNFYVNYFPRYSIHYSRYIDVIPGDIARYHVGDLKVVYGRVYETYYDPRANEFYLYFGSPYPRQDLTVVVTGRDARRLARKPARYFIGWDFSVAGLITSWEGKPEVVINDKDQLQRF